jgi:hypothetical protein
MSLVTLADMKTYLGVVGAGDDAFLEDQLAVISDTVEAYCGRVFSLNTYTQTFYADEMEVPSREVYLFHYPLNTLTEVLKDGEDITSEIRPHKPTARLVTNNRRLFFGNFTSEMVITYDAGYSTIPAIIQSVVKSLVEERYNKKKAGLDLNFGRDVQSISIPGTINVQFDYTLQANERKNAYGMILGDYTNTLDPFRSERALIGEIRVNYVE